MSEFASRHEKRGDTDDVQPTNAVGQRIKVPVSSGVLVYETRELGRELIGFEDVEDWDDVADALRARGHGTGAIHHLPELDVEGSA